MCNRSPACNLRYLRSPMGVVKVVNVVTGAVSLILVGTSYVPIWTLGVFLGTVGICLLLSVAYLLIYLLASTAVLQSKGNRVASFLFHVLAGTALVVAGIELIGWSEYVDPSCKQDCPRLYTVRVAKTLTFMNGVLYLIVGFLGMKDDDLLDPEAAEEDVPLLSTTIKSIPGQFRGSPSSYSHNNDYYPRYIKHPRDDARSNYNYRMARSFHPQNSFTSEFSFNNTYGAFSYGGTKIIPVPADIIYERQPIYTGEKVPRSMPGEGSTTELQFVKE